MFNLIVDDCELKEVNSVFHNHEECTIKIGKAEFKCIIAQYDMWSHQFGNDKKEVKIYLKQLIEFEP